MMTGSVEVGCVIASEQASNRRISRGARSDEIVDKN
jgi:hypothetical protein